MIEITQAKSTCQYQIREVDGGIEIWWRKNKPYARWEQHSISSDLETALDELLRLEKAGKAQ